MQKRGRTPQRMATYLTLLIALWSVQGCDDGSQSQTVTLYRNSPFDHSLRVHWATFDAADKGNYNLNNCLMAARVLNANVTASARSEGKQRDLAAGFWCETGNYQEKGRVPASFSEAFPTDA
jgi:hypothetical protein